MPNQTAPTTNNKNNPKNLFTVAIDLSKHIGNTPVIKNLELPIGIDFSQIFDAGRIAAEANLADQLPDIIPNQSATAAESAINESFGNEPEPELNKQIQPAPIGLVPTTRPVANTPSTRQPDLMEGDMSQFPNPQTTPAPQPPAAAAKTGLQTAPSATPDADELAELMEEVQGPAELGVPPGPSAPPKATIAAPPPTIAPAEETPETVFNPYTEEREPAPPGGLPPGATPAAAEAPPTPSLTVPHPEETRRLEEAEQPTAAVAPAAAAPTGGPGGAIESANQPGINLQAEQIDTQIRPLLAQRDKLGKEMQPLKKKLEPAETAKARLEKILKTMKYIRWALIIISALLAITFAFSEFLALLAPAIPWIRRFEKILKERIAKLDKDIEPDKKKLETKKKERAEKNLQIKNLIQQQRLLTLNRNPS